MVGLLSRALPLPAAAVVQPVLEGGGSVSIEGVLKEVGPVLHAPSVPPPLSGSVQTHGMAPALHLHMHAQSGVLPLQLTHDFVSLIAPYWITI